VIIPSYPAAVHNNHMARRQPLGLENLRRLCTSLGAAYNFAPAQGSCPLKQAVPIATLTALQTWLQEQCDGEWEHRYGVTIQSTDNPGWRVTIDLRGTALEGKPFEPVVRGNFTGGDPQPPWLHWRVKEAAFRGAGDLERLDEILSVFLAWSKRE
jgi:hypothetical protein